jgi:hypothetical protein
MVEPCNFIPFPQVTINLKIINRHNVFRRIYGTGREKEIEEAN